MDVHSLAHLEQLGYEGVLLELAKGDGRLGQPGSILREDIEHWLRLKENERNLSSSTKRDAREMETLDVAKAANIIALSAAVSASDANTIARSAKKYALIAAIAAIVAAVAAIKWR